jgi:multidrug efflux pump subunit AcrB
MMAAYILKPHKQRRARRPQGGVPRGTRRLAHGALHGHHALVPAAPRHHHVGCCGVLPRLHLAGAAAADRLRAGGGPRSDADHHRTAPRQYSGRDPRRGRTGARRGHDHSRRSRACSARSAAAPAGMPSRPAQPPRHAEPCSHSRPATATTARASMADIDDPAAQQDVWTSPAHASTVGPPDSGVKMQLVLKSDDPVALLASAQKVERELRTLQGVGNISSSASLVRPEIIVRPDSARAADLGVTAASHRRDRARSHRRRLRHQPAQAEPVANARYRSASSCPTPCAPIWPHSSA